jgi:dihydroorotate dehydrogenase
MPNKFWKFLPAELAHALAPLGLKYYASKAPRSDFKWRSFQWRGLDFRNPVGISGGVDKNAEHLEQWQNLGAGFLEIGTVTPYSQNANSGKILDRDWEAGNLWNRMGFPNHGAEEIYFNLRNQKDQLRVPVFVNIGKNRNRANEEAEIDYLYLFNRFAPLADAFVINISSPNTQGLRSLQSPQFIQSLFSQIKKESSAKKPLLLKLSPDMSELDFCACVEAAARENVDGFILTNTTLSRPANCQFPKEGGLSGQSLRDLSRKHLELCRKTLGAEADQFLIVSVGGISTSEEILYRLEHGAHLVQLYSALVFSGPLLLAQLAGGPLAPKN